MSLNHYRFDLAWDLDHPRDAVFAALTAVEAYPSWWPDYREVRRRADDGVDVVVQSSLPYQLRVTHHFRTVDQATGHLRMDLRGDIAGWIDYALSARPDGGTRVAISQECTAERTLLRLLAPLARRAFAHNHALMMRRGRDALAQRLSGA